MRCSVRVNMKMYFQRAELLLESNDAGEYVLQMKGTVLARFRQEKRAIAEYNKIRRELENQLPPAKMTESEKQLLLQQYLADNLVGHNSYRPPAKKPAKSRTFG
jgi:hypothetical protein